jgi:predicted phosphodiesterase
LEQLLKTFPDKHSRLTGFVLIILSLMLFSLATFTIIRQASLKGKSISDNTIDITLAVTGFDLESSQPLTEITPTQGEIAPTSIIIKTTQNPAPTQVAVTSTPFIPTTIAPSPTAAEGPPTVVAFYADPQSDSDAEDANHQQIVNYILARGANPVFNAGDIMEDGTQASLDRFNAVTATLRSSRTFYSALGNNDRVEGDASTPSSLYLNNFNFPNNERWYSINWGNLHMVVLDSAFAASNMTQRSWLAADLQSAASQSKITGVIFHHPSFATTIQSYLVDYNVDFVIMGHDHGYRHYVSNGIHHFVNGGQPNMGYFIAWIYENRVTLSAYNQYNGTIATISFDER